MPHTGWRWWAAALVAVPLSALGPPAVGPTPAPLRVEHGDAWVEWWRVDDAPTVWSTPHPAVAGAVVWEAAGPGLTLGTLRVAGAGWRVRVVLVALDPALHRFRLALSGDAPRQGRDGWTIDRAPARAVVALNAGQFQGSRPWGWVVRRGRALRPPGRGPLVATLALDSVGAVHWISDDQLPDLSAFHPVEAFQSYPVVLAGDGGVPWAIRAPGRGVDTNHRDSRLALGRLRDGRLLVALTRFDSLGGRFPQAPYGPTVPEMAAILGALGCRTAVLLDGGLSGQLLVRDSTGTTHRWPGLRKVPLGLLFEPVHRWSHP